MKKAVGFALICLVWGWTPSSGSPVISPAAELGTRSTWQSLLQGAGWRQSLWVSGGASVGGGGA